MCLRSLHTASYLTVSYDYVNKWLYADWQEQQSPATVQAGSELLLQCLKDKECHKLLTDNTRVLGSLTAASEWVKLNLFQQLADIGVAYIAWVHSSNCYSRYTADFILQQVDSPIVAAFNDLPAAYAWLQHCDTYRCLNAS
ncbi:hypothetical protein [Hymenobacter cavernae]|nr:hypothetical protein [Hymenobacter cavernae]